MNEPAQSKYPLYWSASKKAYIRLEDMALPYLANAWRKLKAADPGAAILSSMEECLRDRGCTFNDDTEQWAFPPKEAS